MPISKQQFKKYMGKIKKIDELSDKLIECGIDIDSKMMNCISELQFQNIQFVEKLIGDKYRTIDWFVYQNEFGKKKFEIEITKPIKKKFVISSVDDLYNYLTKFNN